MISVVIPTLNEEKYLPKLLESIKKQNYKDYEIIVADANSKDKTRQIAKKYGCRIVKGGLHAEGVNNGVRAARGNLILVLDVDVVLPSGFLDKNSNEFNKRNLDVASCYIKPINCKFIDKIMHPFVNLYYFASKRIRPFVPSFCFFVKKDFFFKVGGFDKKVPWSDDLAFSNALPKNTKYDILPVHVEVSVRMGERLGRFREARIILLVGLLRILKKNYYGKYEWEGKEKEGKIYRD